MTGGITAYEAAAAMLDAMTAGGIVPRNPGEVASKLQRGDLVRFPCEGERGPNGWARLYLDGRPAGAFGNWRLGIGGRWKAGGDLPAVRPDDRGAIAARRAAEREAERVRHLRAADVAAALWGASKPADPGHTYLTAKRLGLCDLRQEGQHLLVPIRDVAGRLWNVQRIFPDGGKRFLPEARIDGLMWRTGFPDDGAPDVIALGEGFATVAAINRATACPAVAAMTAGNLSAVAVAVAAAFPAACLILCADMDAGQSGNGGLLKANAAALAAGGLVARPPRPPEWPDGKGFDFADIWKLPSGGDLICRALGIARY
jgi:putative DNA primase/helicase